MKLRKLFLLTVSLLTAVLLAGCETYLQSATNPGVARSWVEACIAGQVQEATNLTSVGVDGMPSVCSYLGDVAKSEQIKVAAVEDRSGQVIHSELFVIVQNESASERAIFRLLMATTEERPVVLWAYFCDSVDWNCGYSENKTYIRLWF